jgi:2-hydroxychromene-2-carboxylate isomerase
MQEMNNIPFVGKPAKEKYMWTDIQRRANKYGLSFQSPVTYPLKNFDLANHIAILAAKEGWCEEYVVSTYKNWFQERKPAGEQENIRDSLSAIGQSVDRVISLANSADIRNAYDDATDSARALGIFGSPSFVVNGTDLFWGDDRLKDVIEHCQ